LNTLSEINLAEKSIGRWIADFYVTGNRLQPRARGLERARGKDVREALIVHLEAFDVIPRRIRIRRVESHEIISFFISFERSLVAIAEALARSKQISRVKNRNDHLATLGARFYGLPQARQE